MTRPRFFRANGSVFVERHGRPSDGRFGYRPPTVSALRKANHQTTDSQSVLELDVARAKMLFDNFQALLLNGRQDLGIQVTEYVTKNYTEGTAATTAQFTTTLSTTTVSTTEKTFLRKPLARLGEMAPETTSKSPDTSNPSIPYTETKYRIIVPETTTTETAELNMNALRAMPGRDRNADEWRYNKERDNRYDGLKSEVNVKRLVDERENSYETPKSHANRDSGRNFEERGQRYYDYDRPQSNINAKRNFEEPEHSSKFSNRNSEERNPTYDRPKSKADAEDAGRNYDGQKNSYDRSKSNMNAKDTGRKYEKQQPSYERLKWKNNAKDSNEDFERGHSYDKPKSVSNTKNSGRNFKERESRYDGQKSKDSERNFEELEPSHDRLKFKTNAKGSSKNFAKNLLKNRDLSYDRPRSNSHDKKSERNFKEREPSYDEPISKTNDKDSSNHFERGPNYDRPKSNLNAKDSGKNFAVRESSYDRPKPKSNSKDSGRKFEEREPSYEVANYDRYSEKSKSNTKSNTNGQYSGRHKEREPSSYDSPKYDADSYKSKARKAIQRYPIGKAYSVRAQEETDSFEEREAQKVQYKMNNAKAPPGSKHDNEPTDLIPTMPAKQSTPPFAVHQSSEVSRQPLPQQPQAQSSSNVSGPSPGMASSPSTRPTRIVKFQLVRNETVTVTYTPKAVSPTTTKKQDADDNGRYFSQFYPQLLTLLSQKSNADVGWLKNSLCTAMDVYHVDGKLRFLSVLDNQLMEASNYLRDMPDDQVKEMAIMADELFKDDKLAGDTRELVDFLNYIYGDKDADHMSLILYNVAHYPNETVDVGKQIVHFLIFIPLKRISVDTTLLHAFIDVAMTFIERFKKPEEVRRALPRRLNGGGTQTRTTERGLHIEYTPLNLRRSRRTDPKEQKQKNMHKAKSKSTEAKDNDEKSSSDDRHVSNNSKQRRFQIVRRENANQQGRRHNEGKNKMAARSFRKLSRHNAKSYRRVDVTTKRPLNGETTADSLRKYLYDCVERLMYKN